MKTAEIARRTTPEAFCLEFLVSWALWSGMRASKTPGDGLDNVFLRRGIVAKGKRPTSKKLRATDAVKMVKGMAQTRGVDKGHVASKGMRKGFVCAGYLFFQNEIEARSKAVRRAKERGGNWEANSKVTEEVYLHTEDRGPLGMTSSWEEGVKIGGSFDVWIKRQGAGTVLDGKGGASVVA
jgi:hypothetical protein